MGKRLKLRQIHEVLDTCLRYGIQPTTSFILGFPDEELDDVRSTIRLAFECRARGARRSFINLLSAYTGTPVMREQQDRMKFVRSEANTTMTSFLEEHHYAYIENDREVFSNYYSIDYSQSAIGSASKYGDLVDFYTICLFKYRFSIAHLINEIGVDPIAFFDQCRGKISDLSVEQRNKLGLDLSSEDIRSTVLISQHLEIETMHALDLALWSVTTNKRGVLVNGKLVLNSISGDSASFSAASPTRYFLVGRTSVDVHISPLSDAIGQLYEAQGMEIYRPASLCGSAVAKT
jgi:hypothetical protein